MGVGVGTQACCQAHAPWWGTRALEVPALSRSVWVGEGARVCARQCTGCPGLVHGALRHDCGLAAEDEDTLASGKANRGHETAENWMDGRMMDGCVSVSVCRCRGHTCARSLWVRSWSEIAIEPEH
eukprot:170957-Chlamydomonas_euryale.AAC.2